MSGRGAHPGVVLAAVVSCLLIVTGFLAGGRSGAGNTVVSASGDRVTAARIGPAPAATSDVLQPRPRLVPGDDRAPAGWAEHLAVGPGAVDPAVPAARRTGVDGVATVPVGTPRSTSGARAPPAA